MHGDTTLLQVQRLLPPPPKHKRVATLEAQHFVPRPSALAQQLVNFVLRQRDAALSLRLPPNPPCGIWETKTSMHHSIQWW